MIHPNSNAIKFQLLLIIDTHELCAKAERIWSRNGWQIAK